ncbi:MAG: N-acetylmuramoyl-L-alanine amidase [Acidaminococcaceae bacterium]|nr:N-acetylmuramoyl-L-alanine amidase [Acidaminococcaceae bacterium]MBQ6913087.1 N-acetylmuramoyl-L-alanine amidase [Acidaminococcaceae bacterium]
MLVENPTRITEAKIKRMAKQAKGRITAIYLHWTAGRYGQVFDDYHLCIGKDGTVYVNCDDFCERKSHTWHRNTGTIGIALCCGYDAECELPAAICAKAAWSATEPGEYRDPYQAMTDLGSEPPTAKQIDVLAKIVAILCSELDFPNSSDRVMTHCEVAFKDGYGPGSGDPETKWDLWFLPDDAREGKLYPGGCLIRGKAAYYLWGMKHRKKAA